MNVMTSSSPPGDEQPLTITASWPPDANAGAQVSNLQAWQWDQDRVGVYVMFGHIGVPVFVAPGDRERWEAEHPDSRLPVDTLGAFYLTERVAKDLCLGLANHLGLPVTEGAPGAATTS